MLLDNYNLEAILDPRCKIIVNLLIIFYAEQQNNISDMLPYRNKQQNQNNQLNKRKTKQGDWVCIRCANYNYSFRNLCNRCRAQTKDENNSTISVLTHQNYGQNSFPSALFLKLDPLKAKDIPFPTMKQNNEKVDKNWEQGFILKQNKWINNLINQ